MEEKIAQLKRLAAEKIQQHADTMAALNDVRVEFFGKKGEFTTLLRGLKELAQEERPRIGQIVNEARGQIEAWLEKKKDELRIRDMEEKLANEKLDVTLPGRHKWRGHLHPLTLTLDRIKAIFMDMGFTVEEGPEIERDYFNFEAYIEKSFLNDALSVEIGVVDIFYKTRNDIRLSTETGFLDIHKKSDSREFTLTVKYRFNPAKSKYKGTGAGNDERARM